MTRKPRIRIALTALAVSVTALGAVSGVASASGSADTKVVIKAESDGFFGYVKSSNPDLCANGRKVTLFKQTGATQDPHNDIKVGSDIAQANGTKYMWSTGNTGSIKGSYYARAGKTAGCKAANSKTITS